MRRLAPCCIALLGAAVVFPAGAHAGLPGAGLTNAGHPFARQDRSVQQAHSSHSHQHGGNVIHSTTHDHGARCMCPDCQVTRAIEQAEGAPVVIHGVGPAATEPCAACEASGSPGQWAAGAHAEAPGYASVRGSHPGYASVSGAPWASAEPTPIGVVRTDFAPPSPVDPAVAAFHQAARPMSNGQHHAADMMTPSPWVTSSSRGRSSVLGRMLGFRSPFSQLRAAREARLIEAHAATPMGMPASMPQATQLPASMVYGR